MQQLRLELRRGWRKPLDERQDWLGRLSALAGLGAVGAMIVVAAAQPQENGASDARGASAAHTTAKTRARAAADDPTWAIGGYSGVANTLRDVVRIASDSGEVTVRDFDWIGKPFVAPIYYGVRVQRWGSFGQTGTMLDFTHAKAIAKPDDVARFTGSHKGQALPASAPVRSVFSKLEFSHGHNMLTFNGLLRIGTFFGRLRPYFGAGAGVSLPHTEVGFANDNVRTYEYQFAGFVGQGLGGLEIDLGRTSVFVEYKFSYAPYDVPLSHEPKGFLLVTDLWRQFTAWWKGEKPPGGRLTVDLATHHGIAGVMVKTRRTAAAP